MKVSSCLTIAALAVMVGFCTTGRIHALISGSVAEKFDDTGGSGDAFPVAITAIPQVDTTRVSTITASSPPDYPAAENSPPVRPYYTIWVEGESYSSQVGGITAQDPTAYGGGEWRVASLTAGASATYSFNVPAAGQYLFSLAGQPIGTSASSPLSYSVDGSAAVPMNAVANSNARWGILSSLCWNNVTLLNFSSAGNHTIQIALVGARTLDGTFSYAIDALALVGQPTSNTLYVDANYATAQWGATAAATSSQLAYPATNAMDGNPLLAWESATASPAQSALTITFPSGRNLEVLRVVKGINALTGASMPTSYNVDLLENGSWVQRINETSNRSADVSYALPGMVTATAMRLTVVGTQGNNYPFVNSLSAYGPLSPKIVAPVNGGTMGNNPCNVLGLTQPGASVSLLVNGTVGPVVTADGGGWFAGSVTLGIGANTIGAQANLGSVYSNRQYAMTTYSTGGTSSLAAMDRKGHHVIVNEGVNNVVVTGVGQSSAVGYTVADEKGTAVSSGTLDLSRGVALLPLPSSTAGWYELTLNGSPTVTQSVSVLPSLFVLPATSPVSTDVAIDSATQFVPSADQANFVPVVTAYTGTCGFGWLRDRLSWANADVSNLGKSAGTFEWNTPGNNFDTNISALTAQGQSVMPLIYDFPAYLNSRGDYRYVPDDLRDTYQWGVSLATHYKGQVGAYEFQNEFDWASTAKQTVNTLMGHQRAFYLGVKSVDPNAIVAPSPPAFIADVANELQNLRGEAADVFTFHWYPYGTGQNEVNVMQSVGTGYNMPENMATVTNLLENRAAWLSECGYIGTMTVGGGDPAATTGDGALPSSEELIQADFYAKMPSLALSYAIIKPFSFILPYYYEGVNQFGMLRPNGFSPRPAVNAITTVSNLLRTASYYGSLNTGNTNVEGLVFAKADSTYLLELWALNSAGVGTYALPGGVTKIGAATDYLGRFTDSTSPNSVGVQTTAKFLVLNGSSVTAVTTPSANLYPNPSQAGVAPSPVIMGWHFNLPCKSAQFEDFYDLAQGASNRGYLEIVNLSATAAFTGTITATLSNSRWTLAAGGSLAVSVPSMGRATVPFTLTAPALVDNVRLEARVDDGAGHTSSAAEILQTTGSATAKPAAVVSGDGTSITLDCTAPVQNYFGYDGHLHWTPGTTDSVNYLGALPCAGLAYTGGEMFKAPVLNYLVTFPSPSTWYYVWVKAKAGGGANNLVNVSTAGNPASVNSANGITGFNSGGWNWSRSVTGSSTPAQIGISSPDYKTLNVWSNGDGILISKIILTKDPGFVPTPYTAWQNAKFTVAELTNQTIGGDLADPDGDGTCNLLEYAFGLNPKVPDGFNPKLPNTKGTPVIGETMIAGKAYLTMSYTSVISATDISYLPQVSSDLVNWSSGAANVVQVSVTNNADNLTRTVVARDLIPMQNGIKRFMRLAITKQ